MLGELNNIIMSYKDSKERGGERRGGGRRGEEKKEKGSKILLKEMITETLPDWEKETDV